MTRTPRVVAAIVAIALGALLLSLTSLGSDIGNAGGPKIVEGHVYDSIGTPVQGASVVVKVWRGTTMLWSDTFPSTESDGFYTITVDPFVWIEGDRLESTATYDVYTGSNEVIANSDPIQVVDITLGFEIPEFGVGIGILLTIGTAAMIGALANVRRRRGQ